MKRFLRFLALSLMLAGGVHHTFAADSHDVSGFLGILHPPAISLFDLIESLRNKNYFVTVETSDPNFTRQVPMPSGRVPLNRVLDTITESFDWKWEIDGDVISIYDPVFRKADPAYPLDFVIDKFEIVRQPIDAAMATLCTKYGLPIIMSGMSKQPYYLQKTPATMTLEHVTVREALTRLVRAAGQWDWRVQRFDKTYLVGITYFIER